MRLTHQLSSIRKLIPGLYEHEISLCEVMAYLLYRMPCLNGLHNCHVPLREGLPG